MTKENTAAKITVTAAAWLVVAILSGIFLFLASTAVGAFGRIPLGAFLTGRDWNPGGYNGASWGILSLLAGTASVSLLAMAVAGPVGLAIAVYLAEIARPTIREILKPLVEMIASVPSVTLGLVGLIYVAPNLGRVFGLSNGLNAMTAGLLVAVAALPTIASVCEDALSAVPHSQRQASAALAAGPWTTIWKTVIPSAAPGLTAGLLLGLGRVIGETMIVLMVAGNSRAFPGSLLDPVRPMTAGLAIEIRETAVGSLHWQALFAVSLVLFLLSLAVNLAADFFIHRQADR